MLESAHHELAVLREKTRAIVGRLEAHGILELLLEGVETLAVVGDLLCHGLRAGKRGVRAREKTLGALDGTAHELTALVLARELVRELAVLHLETHRCRGPLFRRTDGIHVGILARDGAALVADAHGQIHVDVDVVGKQREPQLLRDQPDTGKHYLVALGQTLDRARAGDVALLVGGRGSSNLVVDAARRVLAREERLRRARRDTQAALATEVIGDVHALLVNGDGMRGTDVKASRADVIAF